MANLSYADYHYAYDVFLTTTHLNLTQWQTEFIQNFTDEGKQCMIDFWSSPKPQGIFCFMNLCRFIYHRAANDLDWFGSVWSNTRTPVKIYDNTVTHASFKQLRYTP